MRYVWREVVVRTVTDSNVEKVDEIRPLVSALKDKEINCSIQLKNNPKFDLTRILEARETDFRFVVIKSHGSLEKIAPYSDIVLLEVNASDEDLVRTKPGISRWVLLSPVDSD